MKKLENATIKTQSWKDKVAHQEGLIRLIQPGRGQKGDSGGSVGRAP